MGVRAFGFPMRALLFVEGPLMEVEALCELEKNRTNACRFFRVVTHFRML